MMRTEKLVKQQQRDMELMKTAMLKHEEAFRQQVRRPKRHHIKSYLHILGFARKLT